MYGCMFVCVVGMDCAVGVDDDGRSEVCACWFCSCVCVYGCMFVCAVGMHCVVGADDDGSSEVCPCWFCSCVYVVHVSLKASAFCVGGGTFICISASVLEGIVSLDGIVSPSVSLVVESVV